MEHCAAARRRRHRVRCGSLSLMVVLHGLWLLGLWMLGHDHSVDPLWLAVFILLQAGRLWVIVSLGRRWTTRVIVLPGASPVARGPYRWLRHPNYVCLLYTSDAADDLTRVDL